MTDSQNPLEVLACAIELRPAGAPAADEIARLARGSQRSDRALVITFDAASADRVEAFAAAERRCCTNLSWDVRPAAGGVDLVIQALPDQLDLLEQLFATP